MDGMGDPYAPPTGRFPDIRLQRAGLDQAVIDDLRADFDDATDASKRDLVLLVASVSDADLANPDGSRGDVLAGWPAASPAGTGRGLTDQESAQAGGDATDGTVIDETYPLEHTVPEVEAYLDGLTGTGVRREVQRVLDVEQGRTDRDPRVGVVSAAQDHLESLPDNGS
jgi:hypothetical protein